MEQSNTKPDTLAEIDPGNAETDRSSTRPETLEVAETKTDLDSENFERSLGRDFGQLSPGMVVFHHTKVKYVPVFAQRPPSATRDQGSQSDTQKCTHASTNTQTDSKEICKDEETEEEECPTEETSREEIIKINLEQHLIYISHCIKPDDLIVHLNCFSEEQKSDILSERNLIKASRKALEILLHDVEGPGRFAELRDALDKNDGNPKIVRILDGDYNPEDQNYVKVVELFTPEIIVRLEPYALMPYLQQKGVFNQMDAEEIRAEERNHGKMRAACILLMYLPRRTVDWFKCFLQALIQCDLEDIAEMLDPDMFKDILLANTNKGSHVPHDIKSVNGPKPEKPKIAPKPMIRLSKMNENSNKVKACLRENTDSSEISETKMSELREPCKEEVIYTRVKTPNYSKEEETVEKTEDVVIYSEFNDETVDYLSANVSERDKIDKNMADCDAVIIWPEKGQGKNQILLKSISREKTDVRTWLRKKKVWRRNVMVTFKTLFAKIATSKSKSKCVLSSVNKIMSGRYTSCEQHITPAKFKPLYGKKPFSSNVRMAVNDCSNGSRQDKSSSSSEIETAFSKLSVTSGEECKTADEETKTSTTESNNVCKNEQTVVKQMIHESSCLEKMQGFSRCIMACGRCIWVLKGSIVDLSVDVIVNTTDNHLSLTTGLAETISQKGGETVRAACFKYIQRQRSIDEGEIFVSEAGNLPAKHVVHVNSPTWRGGTEEEERLLKQAVMNSMLQASVRKARTIALPAIGCGISGFPSKTATELIVRAVRNFFREEQESSLENIYLVDIHSQVANRFHEALCNVFKDDPKCVIEVKQFGKRLN